MSFVLRLPKYFDVKILPIKRLVKNLDVKI